MKSWYPNAEDEMGRIRANVERMGAAGQSGTVAAINYLLGVLDGYIKNNADLNTQISDYIANLSQMVDREKFAAPPGMRYVGKGTMQIDGVEHETRIYIGPSPIVVR